MAKRKDSLESQVAALRERLDQLEMSQPLLASLEDIARALQGIERLLQPKREHPGIKELLHGPYSGEELAQYFLEAQPYRAPSGVEDKDARKERLKNLKRSLCALEGIEHDGSKRKGFWVQRWLLKSRSIPPVALRKQSSAGLGEVGEDSTGDAPVDGGN